MYAETEYSSDNDSNISDKEGTGLAHTIFNLRSVLTNTEEQTCQDMVRWAARLELESATQKSMLSSLFKQSVATLQSNITSLGKTIVSSLTKSMENLTKSPESKDSQITKTVLEEMSASIEEVLKKEGSSSRVKFANSHEDIKNSVDELSKSTDKVVSTIVDTRESIGQSKDTIILKILQNFDEHMQSLEQRLLDFQKVQARMEISLSEINCKLQLLVGKDSPCLDDATHDGTKLVKECLSLVVPRILAIEEAVVQICQVLGLSNPAMPLDILIPEVSQTAVRQMKLARKKRARYY